MAHPSRGSQSRSSPPTRLPPLPHPCLPVCSLPLPKPLLLSGYQSWAWGRAVWRYLGDPAGMNSCKGSGDTGTLGVRASLPVSTTTPRPSRASSSHEPLRPAAVVPDPPSRHQSRPGTRPEAETARPTLKPSPAPSLWKQQQGRAVPDPPGRASSSHTYKRGVRHSGWHGRGLAERLQGGEL